MRRAGAFALAWICVATASGVAAEEPREVPQPDSRRSTSPTSVVTREEIELRQWPTLVEVLQHQPGVHVSQLGGPGQPAQIFMRGQRRGRVLVRIDGIEISDPASKDPATVVPDVLTAEIERVEIRRGPQGAAFGSDAVGGVIDITTRRGSGPARPWARVEAGGFGTFQSSGGIAGGSDRIGYALAYTRLRSRSISSAAERGGSSERDGYENDTVSGSLELRASESLSFEVASRFASSGVELDPHFPSPLFYPSTGLFEGPADEQLTEFRLQDVSGVDRDARRLFARASARLALLDERWVQEWSVGYAGQERSGGIRDREQLLLFPVQSDVGPSPRSPGGPEFQPFSGPALSAGAMRPLRAKLDSDSTRLTLAWTHDLRIGPQHALRFGVESRAEAFERDTLDQNSRLSGLIEVDLGTGAIRRGPDVLTDTRRRTHERLRNVALYAEDRFSFEDVFAEIGVRLHDQDDAGSRLSYRAGIGYLEPSSGLKLFASLATGFRDPDLQLAAVSRQSTQLSAGVFSSTSDFVLPGNPSFEPELVRSAELGLELPFWDSRGSLRVGGFLSRTRNIFREPLQILNTGQLVLLSDRSFKSRAHGLESSLSLELSKWAAMALDYTYTSSELRHGGEVAFTRFQESLAGRDETGIPKHRLDAAIRLTPVEPLTLALGARYVGPRAELADFGARKRLGGYTVVDLALRWKLRDGVTAFARIDNLFDKEYRDPDAARSRGFAGFVGVQLEL